MAASDFTKFSTDVEDPTHGRNLKSADIHHVYHSHITNTVFVFAARYSHSRMTSAAMVVTNALKENWESIDKLTQEQIKREARSDVTCNHSDWESLFGEDFFGEDRPGDAFKPEF